MKTTTARQQVRSIEPSAKLERWNGYVGFPYPVKHGEYYVRIGDARGDADNVGFFLPAKTADAAWKNALAELSK